MTVSPSAVRIKKASGWQDMAMVGPPGPPGAMTLLQEFGPLTSPGQFSFQNIPQTYRHLVLIVRGRGDGIIGGSQGSVLMRFNNQSGNNYHNQRANWLGTTSTVDQPLSQSGAIPGFVWDSSGDGNWRGVFETKIPNYTGTGYKTWWSQGSNGSGNNTGGTLFFHGGMFWADTNPITRIDLLVAGATGSNFAAGSSASLYGIGPNASGTNVLPWDAYGLRLYNCADTVMGAAAWAKLKMSGAAQSVIDPTGAFTVNADDSVSVRDSGWYDVAATLMLYGFGTASQTWVSISRSATPMDGDIANGSTNSAYARTSCSGHVYLNAGEKIYVHGNSTAACNTGRLFDFSIARCGGVQGPPGPSTAIPLVATLPATPVDGQEVYYLADATNGVIWHLRYRASSASAYKWEFIGGNDLYHGIATTESHPGPNGSWQNLATNGPLIVVPLAGEYECISSYRVSKTKAELQHGGAEVMLGDGSGTAVWWADNEATVNNADSQVLPKRMTATAGATIKLRYYAANGSGTTPWCAYSNRRLTVTPVRVG